MLDEREEYDDSLTELQDCEDLWVAVVAQAVIDAATNYRGVIGWKASLNAREWLKYRPPEFYEACAYANLDPHFVIQTYRRARTDKAFLTELRKQKKTRKRIKGA